MISKAAQQLSRSDQDDRSYSVRYPTDKIPATNATVHKIKAKEHCSDPASPQLVNLSRVATDLRRTQIDLMMM